MANAPNDLPEAVYYTLQILKKQHEMVSRHVLGFEALLASLPPEVARKYFAEYEKLKGGRTAQLLAETSQVLDSLIERLEQTYGPLKN
jgi:hypothetical protein